MGFLYSQLFVTPTYPQRSFAGETCIVTGSNTGLGKEAARHLTRLGASKVIIACRNQIAGEQARQDILNTTKADPSVLEVWNLDLASYDSVKAFAKRAIDNLSRIDVLLNNAGIAARDFELFEGHENSTLSLGTIVTSEVHGEGFTKFPERSASNILATLSDPVKANMDERYATSKLLEVLVVRAIAPKVKDTGIILNMLNPGFCKSSLSREAKFPQNVVFFTMKLLLGRSTEVGSRTLIASASAGEESQGKYMNDCVVAEDRLSAFARSEEGQLIGAKVWAELKEILEKIEPGVARDL